MRRVVAEELLDRDQGTLSEIQQSLDDLWRINRYLGGVSSTLRLLEDFFRRPGRRPSPAGHPARILDVGCGDSRLAARLRRDLLRRGFKSEFVVLDRRLTHLAGSGTVPAGLMPVVADAMALPFPPASFDVVLCNLFLHHFSGVAAQEILRGLAAAASEAVIVNDLERSLLPYLFIRCAYPFTRSRITRNDAPASVRQSYTRNELVELAAAAGFQDFEVKRIAPFRLGMTLWKKPVPARN